MRYFIGNWKMFGVPKSIGILNKINSYYSKDKNRNKYRVIMTPPYTLIESYSKYFKNKKISIGAQNCYQKEQFSSNTAAVSPYMLKSVGAKYTLVGHSDNRGEGDTDTMLKDKVRYALKNNLKVVFCIGENKTEKKNKKTLSVLKRQLTKVLEKKFNNGILSRLELEQEKIKLYEIDYIYLDSLYNLIQGGYEIEKTFHIPFVSQLHVEKEPNE